MSLLVVRRPAASVEAPGVTDKIPDVAGRAGVPAAPSGRSMRAAGGGWRLPTDCGRERPGHADCHFARMVEL